MAELERAVQLQSDAHFGREPFQIELIRYVLAAREHPTLRARAALVSAA